jgi:thioredoxin-like negative regulator of GroEL
MNASLAITEITSDSFARLVLDSAQPVFVAVCADGHRSSQELLRLLNTWLTETADWIRVVRVNATGSPGLAQRCGVPFAPGLALFHQGAICYQFRGELSPLELDDLLFHANLLARSTTPLAKLSSIPTAQTA